MSPLEPVISMDYSPAGREECRDVGAAIVRTSQYYQILHSTYKSHHMIYIALSFLCNLSGVI